MNFIFDIMNEITKIEAYKVGDKLFETIEEANTYKYQKLDDIQLGDTVSTSGFTSIFGDFGLEGTVCRIDGNLIWFLKGYCPHEWIRNLYSWKIMNRPRKDLWRKPLKFIHENICTNTII